MFTRPKKMCRRTSRHTYLHVQYTSHLDRNIVRDMRSSTDMYTYEYKSLQTYDPILPTYTSKSIHSYFTFINTYLIQPK